VCVDDDAVAGVIYQPFWQNRGRALWGLVGSGVGGFDVKEPPQNNKVYVTTRSHYDTAIESFINGLKPCEIIRVGGAGNKVKLPVKTFFNLILNYIYKTNFRYFMCWKVKLTPIFILVLVANDGTQLDQKQYC